MAVLHADVTLVADGGGKAAARRCPPSAWIGSRGSCLAMPSSALGGVRPQLVTINGAPGLLMRHPVAGTGTYSFDIVDGRIRALYVVRNPDKLRGFLARALTRSVTNCRPGRSCPSRRLCRAIRARVVLRQEAIVRAMSGLIFFCCWR